MSLKNILINMTAVCFLTASAFVNAQTVQSETNSAYLKKLSADLDKTFQEYKQSVQTYALEREIPVRQVLDNGATVSLIRIMPSGLPEFYRTHNYKASVNVGVVKLRPKGTFALNVTGKNMLIGVWDSGSVNVEHQELVGRVEIKDNIPYDDHGTHVAGTIGATGINPQAQGMAYEANMFAYEFSNDNAEMADEAAAGLILSNHSYGLRTGWDVSSSGTGWQWYGDQTVSNIEDYRFGYYDASNSRVWDDIVYNAPYYMIVKSAGNDRTDIGDGTRPPDGPYDCMEPKSVAKNILTIGAVRHLDGTYQDPEDVVMSEFSSWGPTDDGRIKPDISAVGVDVFSSLAASVTEYGYQSGTSMSAPNTTGGLALLQDYYSQLYSGKYMKAATLKGLVIHTANETGENDGPDYEYGWGLLAIDKAAQMITSNDGENFMIKELVLTTNDSVVVDVNVDGTAPLTATICWTDLPGVPAPISLNPTKLMLINDLDMRIYDEQGNEYFPWIMDPSVPDQAASKGDNFRDNVEKTEIKSPAAGNYKIVIKHKNQLQTGKQDFSLIVSASPNNINPQTLYRIGGSGNWNDPTKWSLNSGGSPANRIPDINTSVVFDNNSFSTGLNNISLSANANCYGINNYSTDSCVIELSSFVMKVDGSIFDENNKISFSGGKMSFSGVVSKNNQIKAGAGAFKDIDFEFLSDNGSWNIVNDFSLKNLSIQNSSVLAKNRKSTIKSININNANGAIVDFSGSTIQGIDNISVAPNSEMNFAKSNILMSNANGITSKTLSAENIVFHNVNVQNASLSLSGDNSYNKISTNAGLTILGTNTIDSLMLGSTSSLTLAENSRQNIRKSFTATGTASDLIELQSDGSANAVLFSDDGNIRFCLDYLDVVNVSVSGQTGFLSGDNSVINANSEGWIELDCNDALFPSFDVLYPCALGEVKFVDTSTGFPTAWNWDFGDLQFPNENISSEQNPYHNYKFEGEYEVTFNVKNSLFDQTVTRVITIENYESGLSVPSININGTRLTASVIAPEYQWYVNDAPISGATDRIYEIAEPGVYYVTVADENCLFRSEATSVTNIGSEQRKGSFSVYPNPSAGTLNLKIINDFTGKGEIRIIDLIGNTVMQLTFNKNTEILEKQYTLSSLPRGVYTVRITTSEGEAYSHKVVINR